jgi:fatty-acyl-CoA synthase
MLVRRLTGRLGPQHLLSLLRTIGGGEFLVSQGARLTRSQLFARVDSLAAGLQALGVRKGDRIATLLPACPEAVYALFLPWVLGTVEVPLDPALGEEALCRILAACNVKVVLTTRAWQGRDLAAAVAGLRPRLPNLRYVLAREAGGKDEGVAFSIQGMIASGTALWRARLRLDEIGCIAHTAGTTGRPKGVVHRRGDYWALAQPSVRPRLESDALRCLLLPFPPHRYPGRLGIVSALLAGGRVVLLDPFDPEQALELVGREGVTQVCGTPAMYRQLLEAPGQARYDLSSLRRAALGGERCPEDLARALHERLRCPLESLYWTTESGLIAWTGAEDPWPLAATSVGRPAPGVEVRIVDRGRRPLAQGEQGEVAVRSRQMMLGYHEDPAASFAVLDRDGWFYTGDAGLVGDDGRLRLLGRLGG